MKIFSIMVLMLTVSCAPAQQTEFAPIGAYWRYTWFSMVGSGTSIYRVVSDTLIQGRRFKKIEYQSYADQWSNPTPRFWTDTYYLTVKDDSVFFGALNSLKFLYNFQIPVSDSIFVQTRYLWNSSSYAHAVVDSVKQSQFIDSTRRIVYFSRYCRRPGGSFRYSNDQLIENVGLLKEGLFWSMWDCNLIEEYYEKFVCYRAGNFGYPANVACPSTVAVWDEPTLRQQIQLHPNPAQSEIQVSLPDIPFRKAQIINILGQSLPVRLEGGVLDVSGLQNGNYFLSLTFDNVQISRPFFVQH
jgi:hypothetical protein